MISTSLILKRISSESRSVQLFKSSVVGVVRHAHGVSLPNARTRSVDQRFIHTAPHSEPMPSAPPASLNASIAGDSPPNSLPASQLPSRCASPLRTRLDQPHSFAASLKTTGRPPTKPSECPTHYYQIDTSLAGDSPPSSLPASQRASRCASPLRTRLDQPHAFSASLKTSARRPPPLPHARHTTTRATCRCCARIRPSLELGPRCPTPRAPSRRSTAPARLPVPPPRTPRHAASRCSDRIETWVCASTCMPRLSPPAAATSTARPRHRAPSTATRARVRPATAHPRPSARRPQGAGYLGRSILRRFPVPNSTGGSVAARSAAPLAARRALTALWC